MVNIPLPTDVRIHNNSVVDDNGCWIWKLRLDKDGYGQISVKNRKRGAHRVSYETFVGEVPEGLVIDHLCRVRACVNPEHLEAVTDEVNRERGEWFIAVNAAKTHCKNGHELSGDNLIIKINARNESGFQRQCRACRNKESRERMKRNYNRKPKNEG